MTTNSHPAKPPSKAAVARHLANLHAEAARREQKLSSGVAGPFAGLIDAYASPDMHPEQTAAVRPFLQQVIAASTLSGPESVRKHCNHVTALAAYALARGRALDVASLLTTAVIDEYVRTGMATASDALKAERRRRLLALARTVNPGPNSPFQLAPISHVSIKPCYTPKEIGVISRVCWTQPTPLKQQALSIVVALGAGAGGDSMDLRALRVRDIEDLGDDKGIQVRFQEPRPRVVPVRVAFEALLRSAVDGRLPGALLLGQKKDRRNTAARAIENAALHKVPRIEPSRLRATWLADLMTDSVPIGLILQAAGLKSARTLAELLPHLGCWMEHKGLDCEQFDVLRGGAK